MQGPQLHDWIHLFRAPGGDLHGLDLSLNVKLKKFTLLSVLCVILAPFEHMKLFFSGFYTFRRAVCKFIGAVVKDGLAKNFSMFISTPLISTNNDIWHHKCM